MTALDRLLDDASSSRDCPGCGRRIQVGQYACRDCWRTLPPAVRRRVNAAWRRIATALGDDDAGARAIAEYRQATAEAGSLLGSGWLESNTEE
jgi:hypothetical protein